MRQLLDGGIRAYLSDRFNRIDLPALVAALAALIVGQLVDGHTAQPALALSVFLLWLRPLRVLFISSNLGPLILLVFNIISDGN